MLDSFSWRSSSLGAGAESSGLLPAALSGDVDVAVPTQPAGTLRPLLPLLSPGCESACGRGAGTLPGEALSTAALGASDLADPLGACPRVSVHGLNQHSLLFSRGSESELPADGLQRVDALKTLFLDTYCEGGNWVEEDVSRVAGQQ